MIYYNPLDIACKSITGAISDQQQLKINIKINTYLWNRKSRIYQKRKKRTS